MKQFVACVDCNNFYVSVERLFAVALWNKPVLVLSNNDGCVVARSNEVNGISISSQEWNEHGPVKTARFSPGKLQRLLGKSPRFQRLLGKSPGAGAPSHGAWWARLARTFSEQAMKSDNFPRKRWKSQ